MEEYRKLTLKDIEDAIEKVCKEQKPMFEVLKTDTPNMYKVVTNGKVILCNTYWLLELDKAIRKGLYLDKIGKLEPMTPLENI